MQKWSLADLSKPRDFFKVLGNSGHIQVATMALEKDEESGEYGTDHPHADQLLVVLAGLGDATISEKNYELWPGDIVLIEAGEKHHIKGKSSELFQSVNFYSPIAYPDEEARF
jgi:quercetin dioxygenase-like cupin family protein